MATGAFPPESNRFGNDSEPHEQSREDGSQNLGRVDDADDDEREEEEVWEYDGEYEPSPWARFFARILDLMWLKWSVNLTLFHFVESIVRSREGAEFRDLACMIVSTAFYILACVWLMSRHGATLGKWIMGIRVTHSDGRLLTPMETLKREVLVFVQGMGLNIRYVEYLFMLYQFKRVRDTGQTSWDEGMDVILTKKDPFEFVTWARIAVFVVSNALYVMAWFHLFRSLDSFYGVSPE